jgi:hypothetical protein
LVDCAERLVACDDALKRVFGGDKDVPRVHSTVAAPFRYLRCLVRFLKLLGLWIVLGRQLRLKGVEVGGSR